MPTYQLFAKSSGFVIVINVVMLGMMKYLGELVQSVEDFSIADVFGVDAIKDTYSRAFEEWKETTSI